MVISRGSRKSAWSVFVIYTLIGGIPCLGAPMRSQVRHETGPAANKQVVVDVSGNADFYRACTIDQINEMGLGTPERMRILTEMSDAEITQMVQSQDMSRIVGSDSGGDVALAMFLCFFFFFLLAAAASGGA